MINNSLIYQTKDIDIFTDNDKTPVSILFVDNEFKIRRFNHAFVDIAARYTNVSSEKAQGMSYYDYIPDSRSQLETTFKSIRDICLPHTLSNYELRIRDSDRCNITYWDSRISPVIDHSGEVQGLLIFAHDLTPMKSNLPQEESELAELKVALRTMLKLREQDKRDLESNMLLNIKNLILPLIDKIKSSLLPQDQRDIISMIESNLNRIVSPFSNILSSTIYNLTPRETQIANLIFEGKASKEIADLLHLTTGSVDSHRNNIRKKLGLNNKRIGLRSYISSLLSQGQ